MFIIATNPTFLETKRRQDVWQEMKTMKSSKILRMVSLVCISMSNGATIADLETDLATIEDIESYSFDELVTLVGPAWNYDVPRNGIVTLDDGIFDLRELNINA